MTPILTTITPYWGRPEQLARWIRAVWSASVPEVQHFLYWAEGGHNAVEQINAQMRWIALEEYAPSIGHIHNLGAKECGTEWMMKLDVDCLLNTEFFKALIPILQSAKPREWFNAGMLMCDSGMSKKHLSLDALPLSGERFLSLTSDLQSKSPINEARAVGTQFICRSEEYLRLGGCLPAFKGWGWEDYQQIYMLEKHWLGRDPFENQNVHLGNVTRLCRDLISRRKCDELHQRNPYLTLAHHWHPSAPKDSQATQRNRMVLYDYITKARRK